MCNPKVYVGTYGKYNNGSLAGGWISLRECGDYQTFLKKCRALHRGEHDPEFMIQDTEDFPDGLGCMEWLSEQEFNDVMAAVAEEDAADAAPAIADQLRAALLMRMGAAPKADTGMYKVWLEEFVQFDEHWKDYNRKHNVGAMKMRGYYMPIPKPSIDNRFCFHDEGPDYEFYCHLMEDKETRLAEYFKQENLATFDRVIDFIEKPGEPYDDKRLWWKGNDEMHQMRVYRSNEIGYDKTGYTLCTDEEIEQILAAYKYGREQMEKRLDAYLKRYGVSKIHTWTYWADA